MKSFVSILLAMLIQFSTVFGTISFKTPNESDEAIYRDNEIVDVIVELNRDSLLEGINGSAQRKKLLSGLQNSDAYKKIISSREKLKEKIESKFKKADFSKSYNYSFVMNGFSLSIPYKYVSALEKLSGVKSVSISARYDAPSEVLEDEEALAPNAIVSDKGSMFGEGTFTKVNYARENGYTGKGTVVAILDTGFDINHEAFATAPENPTLSKKDINLITSFKWLNTIVPIYKHYVSEKIPYVWDYTDVNSDVSNPYSSHGTHVAGIVGGNSETLTGVAPDCRLLLMKVFKSKRNSKANEVIYLAALDDAVKLGADACNMSLSSSSGRQPSNFVTEAVFKRLEKAGVNVICSASNDGSTGYYDAIPGYDTVSTDIIDYGTVGSPSTFNWAMSVASSSIYSRTSIYTETINSPGYGSAGISSFSSWGVSADLKLKPEIIAPGSSIYSSVPGNSYRYMSGTSMAAPYFAGCYALAKQYISEKYPSLEKKRSAELINSLLMSTATPFKIYAANAITSPRRIGAGLVNMEGLLNTKAYLTTTSNRRPKLDLGQDTDGTLEMTFVLNNMSNESLSYKLDYVPLTDTAEYKYGRMVNTLKSKNISKSDYTLEFIKGVSENGVVSVEPNGKTTISLKVTFKDSFLEAMKVDFKNGFFLDGFVRLKSTTNEPRLSIPYVAFFGDWETGEIFDNTMYSGTPSYLGKQWGLYLTDGKDYYPMGANVFENDTEYDIDTKYCAFSKNALSGSLKKSYVTACVGLLRNAKRVDYNVFTDGGFFRYCGSTLFDYERKTVDPDSPAEGVLWGFLEGAVTNGQSYVYTVSTKAQNFKSGTQKLSFPFVVDNNAPSVVSSSCKVEDGKLMLSVKLKDNRYLMGFEVISKNNKRIFSTSFKNVDPIDGCYTYEACLNSNINGKFSFANLEELTIRVVDYAYNETFKTINVEGDLTTLDVKEGNTSIVWPDFPILFKSESFSSSSTVVNTSDEAEINYGFFDKAIKKLQSYLDNH